MDVVVNVGRLLSGDVDYVTSELREIAAMVAGTVPLRAILEVGYLHEREIRLGCDCAVEAGVEWVKTATGWSGRPTTVEHIRIISDQLAGRARMKAAGGIRDLRTVTAMAELGVTRFGMNADVAKRLAREAAETRDA
jgi:deoxyribose-phosphate aldolase